MNDLVKDYEALKAHTNQCNFQIRPYEAEELIDKAVEQFKLTKKDLPSMRLSHVMFSATNGVGGSITVQKSFKVNLTGAFMALDWPIPEDAKFS